MSRQLAGDVHLPPHPFGEPVRYRAGTLEGDLPDGVAARIVNPAAWQDVVESVEAPGEPVVETSEPVEPAEPVEVPSTSGLTEPPRGGKGSGEEAWRSFAAALGQVVPEHASRDEIVDQLLDAGLIEREG